MYYRADIDGLRAVAVVAVVLFHAFPGYVPGGFAGVDIFFVISGFLITGNILRDMARQRFSLAHFYSRRIFRIFPALIVVLAAVMVFGWIWLLPAAYSQLGLNVTASAAFVANIALLLQSGYFDIESAKKPLLHLWSLGIEEQFYLFWPLLLMLAARLRWIPWAVAAVVALASFVLNLALIGWHPIETFYLPFTRAWELLVGALLAASFERLGQSPRASNARAAIGAVLIAIAIGGFNSYHPYPGWRALLPVVGSALVLSAPAAWGCRWVLASRPLVGIGLISYPLYLWHWPLLVFFAIVKFWPLTIAERLLTIAVSFLLAWLTYRYVEQPLRSGRSRFSKVSLLSLGLAVPAVAGGFIVAGHGLDFRIPAEIRQMTNVPVQSAQWRMHECMLGPAGETTFAADCIEPDRKPLLFVWGDSTAAALMPGLRKAQQTRAFGLAQFTSSACPPAIHIQVADRSNCEAINDQVLATALKIRPEIVLLHFTFDRYSENTALYDRYLDHIGQTIVALKQQTGARVVVLGPLPRWTRGLPTEILWYYTNHRRLIPARWAGLVSSNEVDRVIRAKFEPLGAELISAWDVLCNTDGCLTRLGDSTADITMSDWVHLTEKGSDLVVQSVIDRIIPRRAESP